MFNKKRQTDCKFIPYHQWYSTTEARVAGKKKKKQNTNLVTHGIITKLFLFSLFIVGRKSLLKFYAGQLLTEHYQES